MIAVGEGPRPYKYCKRNNARREIECCHEPADLLSNRADRHEVKAETVAVVCPASG